MSVDGKLPSTLRAWRYRVPVVGGFVEAVQDHADAWDRDLADVERFRALARKHGDERDAAMKLLADVMESLRWSTERDDVRDPVYERKVEEVCGGAGYGALMDSAQRCWRRHAARRGDPVGGEHIAGPCRGTVDRWLREFAALPGGRS